MKILNVLLISPKDPKDPTDLKFLMGGENTYTNQLLNYPPHRVKFTYFIEALKKKEISYTRWQKMLPLLIKFRILPLDSGYHCIRINKKFDLVHCHSYSLKLEGKIKPPVILGDSSSNYLFLRDYLGWSLKRIAFQYWLRRNLHKFLNVFDRDLNIDECAKLIVFSEFAKKTHVKLGCDPKKIIVIPPGLLKRKIQKRKSSNAVNILFAGVWLERKGGLILLKAYERLRKKYTNLKLTLLGPLPKDTILNDPNIIQYDFVSYERLLNEFYPSADIFVLVPPVAEGFGMVVLEAASFAVTSIVSSVYALPELVEHGKTGLVIKPGSVLELVRAIEYFIVNPKLRKRMGEEAKERFIKKYSIEVINKQLLSVYKMALKRTIFLKHP